MLNDKDILPDGTIIGFWHIEESLDELLSMLDNQDAVMAQISNYDSSKRKLEVVATRVLLAKLLGEEKNILYGDNNAPFLEDNSYYISISHTDVYVGVILNKTHKVGIDIEKISDKTARVKDKFLSSEEQGFIERTNSKVHLTLMWAIKESIYKISDKKISDIINHIQISPFIPYIEGEVSATVIDGNEEIQYLLNYKVEPNVCKVWVIKDNLCKK